MNKKLIAIAAAGMMTGAVSVANAEVNISGFVDSVWTLADDGCDTAALSATSACSAGGAGNDESGAFANASANKFATTGEIDVMSTMGDASVRLDLDVMDGGSDVEQAYVAWNLGGATLMMGTMNNPVGLEAEDAPDMLMTSHGQLWNGLDSYTTQSGNNTEGLAVAFDAGPASITVGLLEEISGLVDDENSILLNISGDVMDGLNVELGYVTMADNGTAVTTSLENVTDLNATWQINDMFWAALEFASYGKVLDAGWTVAGGADFGNGFGAVIRLDSLEYEAAGTQDTESTAVALTYGAADNLTFLLEFYSYDNGTPYGVGLDDSYDVVTLEAIGTF